MCICAHIHTCVFTLKINWLIVRGNIPPLNQLNSDNWLPQLGFNHQTLCFHASFCSRIYLSALLEVCWSHPGGCNDVCDGHFIRWPSADSRERTPGCPVPCDVTRARGLQLHSHSGSQPLLPLKLFPMTKEPSLEKGRGGKFSDKEGTSGLA